MKINKEKIYQKFEDIKESLQQLDKVRGITLEGFLQNSLLVSPDGEVIAEGISIRIKAPILLHMPCCGIIP